MIFIKKSLFCSGQTCCFKNLKLSIENNQKKKMRCIFFHLVKILFYYSVEIKKKIVYNDEWHEEHPSILYSRTST